MTAFIKSKSKDESRIGDCAANQPLSGTNVVNMVRNGYNPAVFVRMEETKKAG